MKCPHRNELIQLNGDDLPSDRSESLFDHLEACEPCATAFEQLAESTNNLGEHLAGIHQKDIQKERIEKSRIQRAREKIAKRPGNDEHDARPETGPWESQYALSPRQKLGEYEIIRLLGSGGMAEVYEARHSLMDHRVAIKVIRGRHQDNPVAYQKFLTEMKTLVRVEHLNLVRALHGGLEDGLLFVVMELLDGDSLHTLCAEGKIGSAVEIIDAMLGLCRGLEKLHAHQLLHRDIKPANIMRLKDGTIKVIDLGLAADNVVGRQMSHVGAGTQGYMPPEQTYGSESLNERSDIFSAGRVLKDLLQSLPDAPANSNQDNTVSKLEKLAEWMTKLGMEDRPQSVKEVIVELKRLAGTDLIQPDTVLVHDNGSRVPASDMLDFDRAIPTSRPEEVDDEVVAAPVYYSHTPPHIWSKLDSVAGEGNDEVAIGTTPIVDSSEETTDLGVGMIILGTVLALVLWWCDVLGFLWLIVIGGGLAAFLLGFASLFALDEVKDDRNAWGIMAGICAVIAFGAWYFI